MFHNLIQGIKNLLYWFPIIWQDRNWDWTFLLIILRHKLARMARYYDNDALVSDRAAISEQMRVAISCLDELIDETTFEKLYTKHVEQWGQGKMRAKEDGKVTHWLGMTYPLARTRAERAQAERAMDMAFELSERAKEDALSDLLDILDDHLLEWWD